MVYPFRDVVESHPHRGFASIEVNGEDELSLTRLRIPGMADLGYDAERADRNGETVWPPWDIPRSDHG